MSSPPEDPTIKGFLDELTADIDAGKKQSSSPAEVKPAAASQAAAASQDEPKKEDP